MAKKLSYNARLRRAAVNIAQLSEIINISPSLFIWRYDKPTKNHAYLTALAKGLDHMIYEIVTIRDEIVKEAWNIAQEKRKELDTVIAPK